MEKTVVDTRGLSCPQPVILTTNAMKNVGSGEITVFVDTETAKENVRRAAESSNWKVLGIEPDEDGYRITIGK